MQTTDARLPEITLIQPIRRGSAPGYFSEVFREGVLAKH